VDVSAIARLVGRPENAAAGQRISDDSVTLVRDDGKLLPLTPARPQETSLILYQRVPRHPVLVVILCDNVRADDGRVLEREIKIRMPEAIVVYVDPRVALLQTEGVLRAVQYARKVIVAVYIVPSAARTLTVTRGMKNAASLPPSTAALFGRILARAPEKTAVLAMGNPYLTDEFPTIQTYVCTFSNATVSEISAARALFGEIPIRGHLPVNMHNVSAQNVRNDRPPMLTDKAYAPWLFQPSRWLLGATQLP